MYPIMTADTELELLKTATKPFVVAYLIRSTLVLCRETISNCLPLLSRQFNIETKFVHIDVRISAKLRLEFFVHQPPTQ